MEKINNLEKKIALNLSEKALNAAGSLLIGILAGAACRYYDNLTSSHKMLVTASLLPSLGFIGSIAYIKYIGKGIENKKDAIMNNIINYGAALSGMLLAYIR